MTKEELKALIDAKIAGQGSAVDTGGALPAILSGILDLIPGAYSLPIASDSVLGGIKVGENLSITEEGVLSASGGGAEIPISVLEYNDDDSQYVYKSGKTFAEAQEILTQFGLLYIKAINEADGAIYYGLANCSTGDDVIKIPGTSVVWHA